jgi:hypothetical protein
MGLGSLNKKKLGARALHPKPTHLGLIVFFLFKEVDSTSLVVPKSRLPLVTKKSSQRGFTPKNIFFNHNLILKHLKTL